MEEKPKRKKRVKEEAVKITRAIITGKVVSSTFFSKHKYPILIVLGLFIFYITFKYECQVHMEKIAGLQRELAIVKSESIRERSIYRSRTRESVMQHRIDSIGLRLTVQTHPPFVIDLND